MSPKNVLASQSNIIKKYRKTTGKILSSKIWTFIALESRSFKYILCQTVFKQRRQPLNEFVLKFPNHKLPQISPKLKHKN